tara:strand:- start:26 stop:454 length:429 start_codon:yes stop_codon:yes gene_type:complete
MRFENKKDLDREEKAIIKFVSVFKGSYNKLGDNDIDFEVLHNNKIISYVEVKGRLRTIDNAFPLPISARKLVKLSDKKVNPVVIWACEDGIIYSKVKDLEGSIRYSGRKPRKGSTNDLELMTYYNDNKNFKIIKYIDKTLGV